MSITVHNIPESRQAHQRENTDVPAGVRRNGRFSFGAITRAALKVATVAAPLLLLASQISGADAGPAAYAICVAACGTIVGVTSAGTLLPAGIGPCISACWTAFLAPTL
ncbi:MAG: hypothetical protein P4L16_00195 [Chlamydiales bacterium]|nr:hypothetical protein [Chlamydiales bacterium]